MASLLFFSAICLVCILFTGKVHGTCVISTEYGLMEREHRRCASKYPTVASLNPQQASGVQMVELFRGYCQNLPSILTCVRNTFDNSGCSEADFLAFSTRAERTDYFCDNGDIKPFISDIFEDIPTVGSYGSNTPCMIEARRGDEICRNQAIANALATGAGGGLEYFIQLMVGTMPCALSHVTSNAQCSHDEALLTVCLRYGGVVVPPELGVNISHILITMDNQQ